jgi:hypothetical protein
MLSITLIIALRIALETTALAQAAFWVHDAATPLKAAAVKVVNQPQSSVQTVAEFAFSTCYKNIRYMSQVLHMADSNHWERLRDDQVDIGTGMPPTADPNEQRFTAGYVTQVNGVDLMVSLDHSIYNAGKSSINICSVHVHSGSGQLLEALQAYFKLQQGNGPGPNIDAYVVTNSPGSNVVMEINSSNSPNDTAVNFLAVGPGDMQ